jgi:hypothetical protein
MRPTATMATAAVAADERPSKRRHVEEASGGVASLDDIYDHNCLLSIMSFLHPEDLDSLAGYAADAIATFAVIHTLSIVPSSVLC